MKKVTKITSGGGYGLRNNSIEKDVLENRNFNNAEDIELEVINPRKKQFKNNLNNLKIKYKKDKKKCLVMLSSLFFVLSLICGTSYAYYSIVSKTDNTTMIEAGTLALTFKNEKNEITLDNALPQKDSDALENNDAYEFTIENTGSLTGNYKIKLDNTCRLDKIYTINNEEITPDKCIPDKYIKVGIKEEDGEYKVLDRNIDKIKGDAQIKGAMQNDEGLVFDGVDDLVKMGYENYDFNNKITVAARFKSTNFSYNGGALIDNISNANSLYTGFEFYVGKTGKIAFQFWKDGTNNRNLVSTSYNTELNKWYTAVVTYDGSLLKLYVNGELEQTKEVSDTIRISNKYIAVGSQPNENKTGNFNGTISQALVINDVLSEEEIKNNYSEKFNYTENDKTLFYQNWDDTNQYVIESDILKGKETKNYKMKLWLDYDTPNDYNSQNIYNMIYSGKLSLDYEQGVTNLDTSEANPPKISKSMVPVYYNEETETWNKADSTNSIEKYKWYNYDEKMWANSITYDHTKTYDESNNVKGYSFDGTSDYIDMGNASFDFGSTITVAARFNTQSLLSSGRALIDNYETAGFELFVGNVGKICFQMLTSTGTAASGQRVCSTTIPDLNTWNIAVATYDGTTMKMYLNGNLESTFNVSDTIKPSPVPILVGAQPNASRNHHAFYDGLISNALVINGVLTEEEIIENYNNDFNYTENENEVFYYNYDSDGKINGATYTKEGMLFDGVNDYIDAGNNYDFGNQITIGARFKATEFNNDNAVRYICANIENGGTGLYLASGSNKIGFLIYSNTLNDYKLISSNVVAEVGKWYTVVATYDGNNIKIYIDGVLKNTVSYNEEIIPSNQSIFIGGNPNANGAHDRFFKGTISDALVIKDALSSDEISSNYGKTFNYKENDKTLFYYDMRAYEGRENGSPIPMDIISTMQVWIPRYKYTVWNYNEDGSNQAAKQPINITFEKGTVSTGEIACIDDIKGSSDGTASGTDADHSEICKVKSTGEICTNNLCNGKTYTHPGFTFGEDELTGIWVGKFEVSASIDSDCYNNPSVDNCNKDVDLFSKPNKKSYIYANFANMANNVMSMNDNNNLYNFSNNDDIHMIKGSEWGTFAYLSRSKYGTIQNNTFNNVYKNNSSLLYTGRSGAKTWDTATSLGTYKYNEIGLGTKASTTYNIYGLYDTVGGAYDAIMSNMVGPDGKTMMSGNTLTSNSGYTGLVYNSRNCQMYNGISYPEEKYYDKYSFGKTSNDVIAIKRAKLGDGNRETIPNYLMYAGYSWLVKGGKYDSDGVYINGTSVSLGAASNANLRSTRFVIAQPE